jgi:hypothetical protein
MRVDLLQELLQIKFGLLLWVVLVFVTVAHVPAERPRYHRHRRKSYNCLFCQPTGCAVGRARRQHASDFCLRLPPSAFFLPNPRFARTSSVKLYTLG